MKKKLYLILIVTGIFAIILGGFSLVKRLADQSVTTSPKQMTDWLLGSGGLIDVWVSHPSELDSGETGKINLYYEADAVLQEKLSEGLALDVELEAAGFVIKPQKRQIVTVEKGRQSITWEVMTFRKGPVDFEVRLSLDDPETASGLYAINPQVTFNQRILIEGEQGSVKQSLILLGCGVLLIAGGIVAKRLEPKPKAKFHRSRTNSRTGMK